ncbi:hypothetical protein DPMN_012885 [Dreissena polymorpha]|uniref:Uncharacterized protein n=1 Tax=Dreissena polymorpha TaxID=45954 RepID=A0A9D4N7V8_DREPO|nr:hypothetical protein DPMN_012885 [Dreissena polymorpha]
MAIGGSNKGAAFFMLNVGVPDGTSSIKFPYRHGAKKDQNNISSVFIHQLGFELKNTQKTENFYRNEWDHRYNQGKRACVRGSPCMVCLIKNTDYSNYGYVVFHVSSDGYCDLNDGLKIQCLSDSVEEYITLKEIVDAFSDENCPGLKDKTRILIIQACRYNPRNPTDLSDDAGVNVEMVSTPDFFTGQPEKGITQNNPSRIPSDLDPIDIPTNFLIIYSTTSHRFAKRNTVTGSWFEDELKKVVDAFPVDRPMYFLQVLTETASNVAKRESDPGGKKNVPCYEHRLTNSIIFRKC